MNFVELVYGSTLEFQSDLVRQIIGKRLAIQGSILEIQRDLGKQVAEKRHQQGLTSELQSRSVLATVNKMLRTQLWKANTTRGWSFEEIDAYCLFDDKQLASCQSLVGDPSRLTGLHLSRLAPLMQFEFAAVTRFLESQENVQASFRSLLQHVRGWQESDLTTNPNETRLVVQAYVVSQCVKTLNLQ